MVLATDLGNHFNILEQIKMIPDVDNIQDEKQMDKVQQLLFKGIIKMGDLSHSCKPLECHKIWTEKINEEFCRQGDKEKKLGLSVSPLCDRVGQDVPSGQIGFYTFIVTPLFTTCTKFFHENGGFQEALNQIEINTNYWKAEKAKAEEKSPTQA